jgi:ABC-2 type transport system ATP-binding protein
MRTSLVLKAITKLFPTGDGVRDVDLELVPGEIHALVGLNGAGKSTLMQLMLGMKAPDSGIMTLNGVPFDEISPDHWARVGHLIEYPLAYSELTVRQNLMLSARLRGLAPDQAKTASANIIDKLNLGKFGERRTGELSLGNRQRVGLASALQHEPDLIILDEPTNALDPSGIILLRNVLLDRAADGASILVSSHHLDEVSRIADCITVINGGRIIGTLQPGQPEIERAFFSLVQTHSEAA